MPLGGNSLQTVFNLLEGRIFTFLQGLQSPGLHFASKMEKISFQYLTIAGMLVPNGLLLVFQKLLIWDSHVQLSLEFKKNVAKTRKIQWVAVLQTVTPCKWEWSEENSQTCLSWQESYSKPNSHSLLPSSAENHLGPQNISNLEADALQQQTTVLASTPITQAQKSEATADTRHSK